MGTWAKIKHDPVLLARHREQQKRSALRVEGHWCQCGKPAAKRTGGDWVCATCHDRDLVATVKKLRSNQRKAAAPDYEYKLHVKMDYCV